MMPPGRAKKANQARDLSVPSIGFLKGFLWLFLAFPGSNLRGSICSKEPSWTVLVLFILTYLLLTAYFATQKDRSIHSLSYSC